MISPRLNTFSWPSAPGYRQCFIYFIESSPGTGAAEAAPSQSNRAVPRPVKLIPLKALACREIPWMQTAPRTFATDLYTIHSKCNAGPSAGGARLAAG
jgi:hypothetical protein